MELSLEELTGLKRRIHFQFQPDEVQAIYQQVFRKYQKGIKVDGFRSGKVPLQILEKRHGNQMQTEAKQQIEEEVVQAAKNKFSIQYAHQPEFSESLQNFDVRSGQDLQSFAEVEIFPVINVVEPAKITVKPEQAVVQEEEVAQQLVDLELHFSDFEETDQAIQAKDRVSLIVEGVVEGGEKFNEKQETTQVFIGQKMLLETLEDVVVGSKVNETLQVQHEFPKDFEQPQLAGKKVDFTLRLQKVERPLNFTWNEESFAKIDPAIKNMEDLTSWVKTKIADLKSQEILRKKIQETADFLRGFLDFPLPEKLVKAMKVDFYRQYKEYQDLLLAVQEAEKNSAEEVVIKEKADYAEKKVTLAQARELMNQKETAYLERAKKELRVDLYLQNIIESQQLKPNEMAINQGFFQAAQSFSIDAQELIKMPYGRKMYEQMIHQNLKDQALHWQWQQVAVLK